jgi:hypothetical protein
MYDDFKSLCVRLTVFLADADADLLREKNIVPRLTDFDR